MDGLDHVVNVTLMNNFKYIKRMNYFGHGKMLRNIGALSQNMINILSKAEDPSLKKARVYYNSYVLFSDEFLTFAKEHANIYTLQEMQLMLDLIYADVISSKDSPRKKEYFNVQSKLRDICTNA
jgi:hypothetical protein